MTGGAAILAGGASRRFGSAKALYPINGRPMIVVVADKLSRVFEAVKVAGWAVEQSRPKQLECFPDVYKGKGALGGIHTALRNSEGEWVFCCGCDMPLLQAPVILRLIESIGKEDILMPRIAGIRQPLHAIYRRSILATVEGLCSERASYLPALFEKVKVRYLEEAAFCDLPNYELSFVSLNDRALLDQFSEYLRHL